jgi:hypothetical protein
MGVEHVEDPLVFAVGHGEGSGPVGPELDPVASPLGAARAMPEPHRAQSVALQHERRPLSQRFARITARTALQRGGVGQLDVAGQAIGPVDQAAIQRPDHGAGALGLALHVGALGVVGIEAVGPVGRNLAVVGLVDRVGVDHVAGPGGAAHRGGGRIDPGDAADDPIGLGQVELARQDQGRYALACAAAHVADDGQHPVVGIAGHVADAGNADLVLQRPALDPGLELAGEVAGVGPDLEGGDDNHLDRQGFGALARPGRRSRSPKPGPSEPE